MRQHILAASPSRLVDCYEYKRRRLAPLRPRMMALSTARHYEPTGKPDFCAALERIQQDSRLDSFDWRNEQIMVLLPPLFAGYSAVIREHLLAVSFTEDNMDDRRVEFERLAADLYIGSARNALFDFFILHTITVSNAVGLFYSRLPVPLQLRMVRSLWLFMLVVYICQGRPAFGDASVLEPFKDARLHSWPQTIERAIAHLDEHVPKLVETMRLFEGRYGTCDGKWRATAAATVAFVTEENRWCYIGMGKEAP